MKGQIKQICVLVKDVNRAMKNYCEILGVGPWDIRHFRPDTVRDFYVKGQHLTEGFDYICAVTWIGDIEFELIQPVEGPNIYWETLQKKGEGLHHFKIVIPDNNELKEYVAELEKKGFSVTQTGWIDDDVHYYFNTESELALVLELGNGGKIGKPESVYPESKEKLKKKDHLPNYKQIALIVDDVKTYMKNYWDILGIGPWDVRHFTPETVRDFYVGGKHVTEGFDFICAVTWAGGIELELIQPIKGPNVYWDFVKTTGQGLHHIKDVIPDDKLDAVIADFAASGIQVDQTGWIDEDCHYYLNAKDQLGMVLELGNGGKIGEPDYRYPELKK